MPTSLTPVLSCQVGTVPRKTFRSTDPECPIKSKYERRWVDENPTSSETSMYFKWSLENYRNVDFTLLGFHLRLTRASGIPGWRGWRLFWAGGVSGVSGEKRSSVKGSECEEVNHHVKPTEQYVGELQGYPREFPVKTDLRHSLSPLDDSEPSPSYTMRRPRNPLLQWSFMSDEGRSRRYMYASHFPSTR